MYKDMFYSGRLGEKPAPTEPEHMEIIPEVETKQRKVIVCLDNGHGVDTSGKCSPWTSSKVKPELPFREYQYTREIVAYLTVRLMNDGYDVRRIVPEDKDIALSERCARINKIVEEAKQKGYHTLSISIHNDASGMGNKWMKATGWSVWTTVGQNNSDILAQCLHDAAKEVLHNKNIKTRADRQDSDDDFEKNFAMCRYPNCPAVLTENLFQDNIKDVEFLLSDEGKKAIVDIHHKGINAFVEKMGW